MNRWPHQITAVRDVWNAIAIGEKRILVTGPTGSGKTLEMQDLIELCTQENGRSILLTNRKMLVAQTSAALDKAGIRHGVISPEHDDEGHLPVQIASIQTLHSRVTKRGTMKLGKVDLAIVDEAHLQTSVMARTILEKHIEQGGCYVGFTATPLDLEGMYTHLVVAGTASECRACGALVACEHYGCDEPDYKQFKKLREGADTISEGDARKAMMRPGVFGRILEWYEKLNPEHKPTILFAPGVRESIYFAEQFTQAGIVAAHIDGTDVWARGKLYRSNADVRASVMRASRDGECKVICNRFVLREGVDAPWLAHCILATCFGSLSSYLQAGGRMLRSGGGDCVRVQDHGGNWWRHGSLNSDRIWRLGDTASIVGGMRADALRASPSERKPRRCPKCGMVQIWRSPICQHCAFECKPGLKISRPVVQMDGTLREMVGDIFRPHRICTRNDGPYKWKVMVIRSRKPGANGRTFRAAAELFARENNFAWPNRRWPYMPLNPSDWYAAVKDVPEENLIQE